jgi:hypothetical protein
MTDEPAQTVVTRKARLRDNTARRALPRTSPAPVDEQGTGSAQVTTICLEADSQTRGRVDDHGSLRGE